MGDLVEVVPDDLLGINEGREKEGQVQMVEFSDAKETSQESNRILAELDFAEEVIANWFRLKSKEIKKRI